MCAFLTVKRGKKLARAAFPDAQVGGSQLDLFTLYKEVVSRGGYKCAATPQNRQSKIVRVEYGVGKCCGVAQSEVTTPKLHAQHYRWSGR